VPYRLIGASEFQDQLTREEIIRNRDIFEKALAKKKNGSTSQDRDTVERGRAFVYKNLRESFDYYLTHRIKTHQTILQSIRLVLDEEGTIIGYVRVQKQTSTIKSMDVMRDYQDRGIGAELSTSALISFIEMPDRKVRFIRIKEGCDTDNSFE